MPVPGAKGSFIQVYNCQAAVDGTVQIIVAADVTDEPNDKQQSQPLLTQAIANTGQVPRTASMDADYFSEANVTSVTTLGSTPLIPPDRPPHGRAMPAAPHGHPPAGLSVTKRMRRTLRTKRSRYIYARWKEIVESVFGQIKQARGFRQRASCINCSFSATALLVSATSIPAFCVCTMISPMCRYSNGSPC